MQTLEIARKFAALGETNEACKAYKLALNECQNKEPATEFECALNILQFGRGEDYKISYTCLRDLYNQGFAQDDILAIMDEAFYQPNVKRLQKRYEKNCKLLSKYPYIFRKDFLPFAELPIIFFPYDDNQYTPYDVKEQHFGEYVNFQHPVISRNFFKDLAKPILAADVFSQYELEYLNDNVRKSEWVARENHIYLHYTSWPVFCAYLQSLDLQALLKDKKLVFLIEDEIEQYPIDFKERFGIDYSQYELEPFHIREINRLIWHTQLSSDNGGDFFNEIFDGHPNMLVMPSIMFDNSTQGIMDYEKLLKRAKNVRVAMELIEWENKDLVASLFSLRNRTPKDIMVAIYLAHQELTAPNLDKAARIAPPIFYQPHFYNIYYDLQVDERGRYLLYSEQYDKIRQAPQFSDFKYIKTFTPIRAITSSYAATIKYKCYRIKIREQKNVVMDDSLIDRVLNRSFMIDWQDRLFKDCRLVRFEDAKFNVEATFRALAAFLDLPYTETMTYCSYLGEHDPLSDVGNARGFSLDAIYLKNAEYANDTERAFIEFCMRDAYKFYGYDFEYWDGQPVDEERLNKWLTSFSIIDALIEQTRRELYQADSFMVMDDKQEKEARKLTEEDRLSVNTELTELMTKKFMEQIRGKRQVIGKILMQDNLQFINRNGQPLHMMPMLEPDPDLLVRPPYRSKTNPKMDIEVQEFSHEEMKPLEETN